MMIFAAIDPGAVSAAIAVFSDATPLFVDDIRTTNDQIDSVALAKALHDMRVSHVVIENVHSMPRQGVPEARLLAVLLAVAVGNTIGREGARYAMKPSPTQLDQASIDGLLNSEQQIKPTLPKKLNDWTTMTEVRAQGKTLI